MVRELAGAGIDFVKDDELLADPPHSRFDDRVDAVMRVIDEHAQRTGRKVMFAFNLTDEFDAMQRHYDKLVAAGATCAMVSINSVGLVAVKKLADRGQLPIHAHRNGWGHAQVARPCWAWSSPPTRNSGRLAGVDQLHVNGIANKFWEPDDSVVDRDRVLPGDGAPGPTAAARGLLRPVGRSGARDLAAHAHGRPALSGGRRHPGAPGRPGRRSAGAPAVVGGGGGGSERRGKRRRRIPCWPSRSRSLAARDMGASPPLSTGVLRGRLHGFDRRPGATRAGGSADRAAA
jgi:hypothetical protein